MSDSVWVHFLENYTIYLTAGSASIGFVVIAWKKGLKPMFSAIKSHLGAIDKINVIFEEITPNGGKSIKDSIDRIEKEVALSRERHRAVNADNESAMFETDLEGNCTWVNRTYSRVAERTPDQLMGHGWVNAIHPEDREKVVADWYKAVEEDREFTSKFRMQTPNGENISAKCHSYKMVDHLGTTLGYHGVIKIIRD